MSLDYFSEIEGVVCWFKVSGCIIKVLVFCLLVIN